MKSVALFLLVILANIFFIWSCSDDDLSPNEECKNALVEYFGMEPYTGQDIGCRSFIHYYENEGNSFAHFDNYCIDLASFSLINCDGDTICNTQDASCFDTFPEGVESEIIGIAPE